MPNRKTARQCRRCAGALVTMLAGLIGLAHGQSRPVSEAAAQVASKPATGPQIQPASTPRTQPASQAVAQRKPLTLEALYGPGKKVDFNGSYARGMVWADDGRHYLHRRGGQLMWVEALTDAEEPAYDRDRLAAALRVHEHFDDKAAERFARRPTQWTADRSAALISHGNRLYLYRLADGGLRCLTEEAVRRREVQLSADGAAVSFVRDNDLFMIDVDSGRQRRVTRDGSSTVLNGVLDWVYQEEIYGRGHWRAHWWRDDGAYLAYLRLDETDVPSYAIVDHMPHHSTVKRTRYPKAGDPNPEVRLAIASRRTGRTRWVDLRRYEGTDILVVRVSWSPVGRLLFSVQDREQRWLELNEADPKTGQMRTLIRESSPGWVNEAGHPHWLEDGSFLWLSERDGYRHIYHYADDGTLIGRLTRGDWPVRSIHGCDTETGYVYFSGSRETVLETHAYRVALRGGEVERLTEAGFDHQVRFDPTLHYFFDTFSNAVTPTKVHLRDRDGALLRVISANEVAALDEHIWSTPKLMRIPNRDGFLMNVEVILPPDFNAGQAYPVWCGVYGAPGAQIIRNRWRGSSQLLDQYLAQQGYIACRIDPYHASGAGAVAAWHGYRRLGESELADIEDALRWLIERGWANAGRIGITGGSYGGFTTAYALTHSRMFKLGIAAMLLSDWRNYDSVYAERYMQTPEHNPEGYERASVTGAARSVCGKLVLAHGLLDENVHFQSTAQLIDALQKHRKMFDLMVYPRDGHGFGHGRKHFRDLRLKYVLEEL